jgi:hypothetical protein
MAGRGLSAFNSTWPELAGRPRLRGERVAEELHIGHTPSSQDKRLTWVLASLAVYVCGALFVSSMLSDASRPEQATAFLERLEVEASRINRLPLETSQELKRLLAQPLFNCMRIGCESVLRTRNLAVRTRLEDRLGGQVGQIATR